MDMLRLLPTQRILSALAAMWATVSMLALLVRYRLGGGGEDLRRPITGPMRVLFVHRNLPYHAGVPRCLLYLARACDRKRINFQLASFIEPSHRMREAFDELGIKRFSLGNRGYFQPSRKMRRILRSQRIEAVVATNFKSYLCAKIAARGTRTRVIFWLHAVRGTVEGPIRRTLLAILARRDPMLFVSQAVRKAQLPPGYLGKSRVIYNGVEDIADHPEYEPYPPQMRETLGLPKDALTLGFTAAFEGGKDHFTAIIAMHELVRRGSNAHLMLIGSGRLIDVARVWAASGPAAQRIHFLGARSDARRILGAVDIYIHPSRSEGFGLAVVEAMLAACPVIAARDGAFVEYIRHNKTGMLFKPGDAAGLADAVMDLAADRDKARKLGLASREFCRTTFDMDRFTGAICDFIEDVCPRSISKSTRGASAVRLREPVCES
jgi:glycosyltransferase involved in cell wall biosynthesis